MGTLKGELVKAVTTIAVKAQSAQGTPAEPSGAEVFRAFDVNVVPIPDVMTREEQAGGLGHPVNPKVGELYRQLTFKTYLAGWGASYLDAPPKIADALRACKLGATEDPTNQIWQYDPISTGEIWSTFYVWWDGILHKLTEAQGSVKFSGEVGKPIIAEFSFFGLWVALSDATLVTGTAFHSTIPPVFKSATFQLDSDSIPVSAFEIDQANVITPLRDPGADQGIRSFKIVNRAPAGSFDPEMTKVATFDWESLFINQTPTTLTIILDGGTGNKITLYCKKLQLAGLTPGERGEIRIYTTPFTLAYDGLDDEFSLKYSHS